jgi:hypothetical protein
MIPMINGREKIVDTVKPCISCGGTSFGEGITKGEGDIWPKHKFFSFGSSLLLKICTDCGEVNSMKVQSPEKFKK